MAYTEPVIALEIDNSYSRITGLTTAAFNRLRKELSYQADPQAAYFRGGYQSRRYLVDKKGVFPTGLLDRVYAFLSAEKITEGFRRVHCRQKPSNHVLSPRAEYSGVTPYADQYEAVARALEAERAGIEMPTGTGKSLVIAMLVHRLNVKTLIIVPTVELKKQLSETLKPYPNAVVENIDSSALGALRGFDALILDEVHHAAAKTYHKLNKTAWKGIYYRFFLTATFFRNSENEQMLFEAIAGKPVFKLSIAKAVKSGYIVPVDAYYIELSKTSTDAYTWGQVYSELVVNHEARNALIANVLQNCQNSAPTLCLVKELAHGAILEQLTGIPFANGQDEDSRRHIERFNKGEIKGLIGTTGILGEGVDTKPAEFIVIAGLGKAKSAFMQQVGRGVRRYPGKESCKVILFKDKSHKFCLRHFNTQCKILKEEYGIAPIRLEVD